MRLARAGISCLLYITLSYGSPAPPSQDPFYSLPEGYQNKRPGEILSHRPLPYPLKDPLPLFYEQGHQIIYRTTDSLDQPTASLATLLIPPNADFSKLFAFLPIQNSAGIDCAASHVLADGVDLGGASDEVIVFGQILSVAGALNQGWVVVMPDFEGFNGAFMANRRGAFAGLDSIRAAIASSDFTGVSRDAVAVMLGYSGASSAAVLAAEYQENYAPELNIAGLATGGLLIDLQKVLELAINAPNNLPPALWGLANEYPEIHRLIEDHLVVDPVKRAEFMDARNQCAGALRDNFITANISTYFDDLEFMNSSTVREISSENSLGQGVPSIPILVYESTHDDKASIPEVDAFVNQYCEADVLVDYRKYEVESHTVLSVDGVFGALAWARERFDGLSMSEKCTTSTHVVATEPDFGGVVPEVLRVWMTRGILAFLSEIM